MTKEETLQIYIKVLNVWPSKSRSRSRTAISTITPFNGKCQNLQISHTNLFASSYHFKEFFWNFLLSKSRSGHGVQFSQLHDSMANVKIYKYIFALDLTVCENLIFQTFDIENVGQGHRTESDTYTVRPKMFQCVVLIFKRNATHCISPYAIDVCLCVSVCVCVCVSVCACHVCERQENGLRQRLRFLCVNCAE